MENNFCVYLHINPNTGEPFYVGKGRVKRAYIKTNRSRFWHNIVDKYGFDVILLEENLTEQEAFEKEIYWINRIGRRDLKLGLLVNLNNGGKGGNSGGVSSRKGKVGIYSKETLQKMSEAKANFIPWNKGRKGVYSNDVLKKMSKGRMGKESNKKGKSYEEFYGLDRSIEIRNKSSLSKKGKNGHPHTEETKIYLSKVNLKPILQFNLDGDLIKEWGGASIASNSLNISNKNISACCNGRTKTSGGYKWKFKN